MTVIPPLSSEIVEEVQQLWPRFNWTNAMRIEWRKRLGSYDVERVLKALRDTYATDTGYPNLAKVLAKLKGQSTGPTPWKSDDDELMDQIDREAAAMRQHLAGLPVEKKRELVQLYRERIHKSPPAELETWSNTQLLLAGALLYPDGIPVIHSDHGNP